MERRFEEAESLAEPARQISEAALEEARVRVATTLKYLGAIYSQQGKLDQAE